MPKQRITKEMVLKAGFQLLRKEGEEQVLVKNIAAELSCSVQPIYSYCKNMEELRDELSEMSAEVIKSYISDRIDQNNPFESTGKAYISFAKEEPHLFKSYFLRKRRNINSFDDIYAVEASQTMAKYLAETLGISESIAKDFHMNMIIFNIGISFMIISTGCNFSEWELNEKMKYAYHAFLEAAKSKGDLL